MWLRSILFRRSALHDKPKSQMHFPHFYIPDPSVCVVWERTNEQIAGAKNETEANMAWLCLDLLCLQGKQSELRHQRIEGKKEEVGPPLALGHDRYRSAAALSKLCRRSRERKGLKTRGVLLSFLSFSSLFWHAMSLCIIHGLFVSEHEREISP